MKQLEWMMWYPADKSRTYYVANGRDNVYAVVQRTTNRKIYLFINNRLATECKTFSDGERKAAEVEALRL